MSRDFSADVLLERARLALIDPIGEWEAIERIDGARAVEILQASARTPARPPAARDRLDDDLIAALGIPPGRSHGLMRCPAHEDRRPSLKWTVKPGGKLLVHCFAGCTIGEIWRAAR